MTQQNIENTKKNDQNIENVQELLNLMNDRLRQQRHLLEEMRLELSNISKSLYLEHDPSDSQMETCKLLSISELNEDCMKGFIEPTEQTEPTALVEPATLVEPTALVEPAASVELTVLVEPAALIETAAAQGRLTKWVKQVKTKKACKIIAASIFYVLIICLISGAFVISQSGKNPFLGYSFNNMLSESMFILTLGGWLEWLRNNLVALMGIAVGLVLLILFILLLKEALVKAGPVNNRPTSE